MWSWFKNSRLGSENGTRAPQTFLSERRVRRWRQCEAHREIQETIHIKWLADRRIQVYVIIFGRVRSCRVSLSLSRRGSACMIILFRPEEMKPSFGCCVAFPPPPPPQLLVGSSPPSPPRLLICSLCSLCSSSSLSRWRISVFHRHARDESTNSPSPIALKPNPHVPASHRKSARLEEANFLFAIYYLEYFLIVALALQKLKEKRN